MEREKRKSFLSGTFGGWIAIAFLISVIAVVAVTFMVRAGVANVVGSGQAQTGRSAVSTLRTVHWAQGIFRQSAYVDVDGNGVGEFGTLAQLAGEADLPGGGRVPSSLLLRPGATIVGELLEAGGYCFRADLPEDTHGRERSFVAWAWPQAEPAGTRAYCLDQDEQIFEAPAGDFVGCDSGPPATSCPPDESWTRWRNKTSTRSVGAP